MILNGIDDVNDLSALTFELSVISTKVLEKVVEFLEYNFLHPMDSIPKPLNDTNIRQYVSEWHTNFISSLEKPLLFEVIAAGNFLDIPQLVSLGCAYIAQLVRERKEITSIAKVLTVHECRYVPTDQFDLPVKFPQFYTDLPEIEKDT